MWRASDPTLSEAERQAAVDALMDARRAVKDATGDASKLRTARARVDEAKHRLGERGPVWWDDGAPDFNRHMAKNTPYADWFESIIVDD